MATADLIGTWFPSGYYGHFRSKTRNDILQEYRHEAFPLPPNQFVKWVRKSPVAHRFSKHDNRHSFPTDASYFDTGMGRRKGKASIKAFNPELISWTSRKDSIAQEGSSVSLYRLDFRKGGAESNEPIPQRLSPRVRKKMIEMEETDARLKWTSDYKKQFSHGQPNAKINTDMSTGKTYDGKDLSRTHHYLNRTGQATKVVPPYLAHTMRRTKSAPPIRYSVGDCLAWIPSPGSILQLRSSVLFEKPDERPNEIELMPRQQTERSRQQIERPHPPTEKRPTTVLHTPRVTIARTQQPTVADAKNRTPAATAISYFSPVEPRTSPQDMEIRSPHPELTLSKPVVIVD